MLDRLVGLETEYAIRVRPRPPGSDPPSNDAACTFIMDAVAERVRTLPGRRRLGRRARFLENGGSLYYEYRPKAPDGGLLEAATPECRGPAQVLLYQKAQERLLTEALPTASRLAGAELGLLRHCRDAFGNVFGVQENYEVDIATGPRLWAWRLGVALLLPLAGLNLVALVVYYLSVLALMVTGVLLLLLLMLVLPAARDDRWLDGLTQGLTRGATRLGLLAMWPMVAGLSLLTRFVGFRRQRRRGEAFFASRVAFTGTGVVLPEGRFALSGRALAIQRRIRHHSAPDARGIFDPLNLQKLLLQPLTLDLGGPLRRFRRRQRFQLGLSEAPRSQVAEYLAIGSATLVLDMIEEGALESAPRLADPVGALHAFASDPGLTATAATTAGELTALELQRWYLEAAERWLEAHPAPALEARELLRLWREVTDALEDDPGKLVGRIDWVTKRYLLETAGAGAEQAVLQKIDLRYHELGDGYAAQLEAAGVAPRVVSEDAVATAMTEAPRDTPAHVRGRLVRILSGGPELASVDWESVQIGGALRGRVVRLADYRAPRG